MGSKFFKEPLTIFTLGALAIMPVVGVLFPRFYAIGPGLIGVIGLVALLIKAKALSAPPRAFLIIPGALLALATLSMSWSVVPETSLERCIKLLTVMLPGVALITLIRKIPTSSLTPSSICLIIVGLCVASVLIIIEMHFGSPLYMLSRGLEEGEHAFGTAVYNRATVAVTLLLFPTLFILHKTTPDRLVKLGFFGVISLMLITGQSQSAQLGLVVGGLTYALFPYGRPKAWYALIIVIAGLIFGAPFLANFLYDHCSSALNEMPFFRAGSGYAGGRTEIWDMVSRRALEQPLTGFGIEATKTMADFDSKMIYHQNAKVLHPHNFAIQFWVEFGVIGATVASALLAYMLWIMKSLSITAQRIALPTFMATLTIAATAYGFWQSWWLGLLFMVTGLCLIAIRLDERGNI